MKSFNTTVVCIPEKHYIVELTERVKEIKPMHDWRIFLCPTN